MANTKSGVTTSVIAGMGLFWRKDLIDWRGQRGRLLGMDSKAKKQGEIDFADQVGIYALYADYHLVYIGRAHMGKGGCLGTRLKYHTTDHLAGRWDAFSWFGLKKVTQSGLGKKFNSKPSVPWDVLIRILEGVLIEIAEPPQNGQGGCLKEVKQYLQVPWVNPEEDVKQAIKYVSDIRRHLHEQALLPPKHRGERMSLLDAAVETLKRRNRPMSCEEILKKIPRTMWKSPKHGKTPVQTLYAAIGTEIGKGIRSRFRKVGPNRFELDR